MLLRGLRVFDAKWNIKQTRYAIEHPWREAAIFPLGVLAGFLISFAILGFGSWPGSLIGVLIGYAVTWYVRGRFNSGERGQERNGARLRKLLDASST